MTARHLESMGFSVLRAYDGMDAIRTSLRHRPDLILLDIMMPRLDGFQVCRFLKNQPPLDLIPVFFMTARDGAGDRQRGLLRGGDDYLTKPLDFHEVARKIHRLQKTEPRPAKHRGEPSLPTEDLSEATAVQRLGTMLDENLYRLSILEEVSRAVADAGTPEEIVQVLLAGCLPDIGLGFDRAVFLARGGDGRTLRGFLALGPFPEAGMGRAHYREAMLRVNDRTLREICAGHLGGLPFLSPATHPWLGRLTLDIPAGKRRYDLTGSSAMEHLLETARLLGAAAGARLKSPQTQAIPVVAKGELIGALLVDSLFSGRRMSVEDGRNLLILCNHVGLALERSRLLEEQERQSRELDRLSRLNAGIVQSAGVGIIHLDAEGAVQAWNRAMARLTGLDAAQALGRRFLDLFPSLEGTLASRRLDQAMADRTPQRVGHFPMTLKRKTGFFDLKMSPVGSQGRPQGVVLLVEDITRRVTLEEKSREVLQHLRDIINYSADAIVVTDPQGRIRTWNEGAATLLGRSEKEARGKNLGLLFPGAQGRRVRADMLAGLSRGETIRDREINFHTPTGEPRYLSLTATPIRRADGGLKAVSLIIRDLTERKKLIAQLVQTEKLASLGVIAAGMAHEINNPLTSISMHTQLLSIACQLKPEAEGYVEKIMEEISRISEIVNDLLVYSRGREREPIPVDVGEVLRQAVTFIRRKTSTDGITVTFDQEGMLCPVQGRANELLEIYLNILSNAADAVSRNGTISVRASMVRGPGGTMAGERLRVVMKDDGCGIPASDLARIFDPFYTTKPPGKGTGLGLMVARELVESYSGKIEVESHVGRGTTVTVELPCDSETPRRPRSR